MKRTRQPPGSSEREYGRLNAAEYSYILQQFRKARLGRLELESEARREGSKLAGLLQAHGMYWWAFYELAFPEHLALFFVAFRLQDEIARIAKSANPTREFIKFMRAGEHDDASSLKGMAPEGHTFVANLVISACYSLEAIGYYGLSINELLAKAAGGDRPALLHAVGVDRAVIGTDTATSTIAWAQLTHDKGFLSGLFKRMKSPHVGRNTYVEPRFMRRALEEAGALASTDSEDLLDLVQGHLGLYTQRRGDPVKGLAERFRVWRQETTMRK